MYRTAIWSVPEMLIVYTSSTHFAVLHTKDAFYLGHVFLFGSYFLRSESLWSRLFRFSICVSFYFASASDRLGNYNVSLRFG